MRIGFSGVPAALIFDPARKTSAENDVAPVVGGFTPATTAPGSIVTVTPDRTNTMPSMSYRHPPSQTWLSVTLPLIVALPCQCSPFGPSPGAPGHATCRPTSVHGW